MNEWSFNHLVNIRKTFEFLMEKPLIYTKNNHNSCYKTMDGFLDKYHYKHLCQRNVRKNNQPGIISVYIDDSRPKFYIDHREWSNVPNKYWYHWKCRCMTCDRVRIRGIDNLTFTEKTQYSNIVWPVWSGQWNPGRITKSKEEIKYEKNIKRAVLRRNNTR